MSLLCQKTVGCALILTAVLVAMPVDARDDVNVEDMVNDGVVWARENLPPELLQQLPLPSDADWQVFWRDVEDVLNGDSLERAAELKPYAEAGIRLLSRVQGGEEYAAWLQQRLDYFEMAAAVVKQYPAATSAFPPTLLPLSQPEPARGSVRIVPSIAEPPTAPPPLAIRRQREAAARSVTLWRRVLNRRTTPDSAAAMVPRLKQVFRHKGIPEQLIWIAEVESSMNPQARNPSGAVGLFQLMPATAERFGLRLRPIDERRSPDKSAEAAARYLRFLHNQFGSWPLALAAYNVGETRVKGLLAKTGGKSYDDIVSLLPIETQMYVPKVQAVIQLREGINADRLPSPTAEAAAP